MEIFLNIGNGGSGNFITDIMQLALFSIILGHMMLVILT